MNWKSLEKKAKYNFIISAPPTGKDRAESAQSAQLDEWYSRNQERIVNAAMGKGSPLDYQLALEWTVRSGKIKDSTREAIQRFADAHLGLECSGLVTNYLVAIGKRVYSPKLVRDTGAVSYYKPSRAVNDPWSIRRGDLLVWMKGNRPLQKPAGHIALVESYFPGSRVPWNPQVSPAADGRQQLDIYKQARNPGNIRVVEASPAGGVNSMVLDSWYHVEQIIERHNRKLRNEVMQLRVKRHGRSGDHVSVFRP
jgi:hypothetical protein